jgi:predicted alpha/beta-hydrolase family hydrolase
MAEAVQFLRENCPHKPIILIGKSFGGRLGSYLGAQSTDVAGYVFLGLPIKGLGKNPKPRDWSHLSKLRGRALFITGDKDRLCPLDELAEAQKHLQIPFQSTIVPGDHSFKPKGAEQALRKCIDWIKDNF